MKQNDRPERTEVSGKLFGAARDFSLKKSPAPEVSRCGNSKRNRQEQNLFITIRYITKFWRSWQAKAGRADGQSTGFGASGVRVYSFSVAFYLLFAEINERKNRKGASL